MRSVSALMFVAAMVVLASGGTASGREPIVGGPCEGCEAVFEGLPAEITSITRLAPENEPGERLVISGTVRDAKGRAVPGIVVYAYHTDARGIYPPDPRFAGQAAYRHGRLRGWARTDDEGRYRFETIRPSGYPNSETPQHVHLHILEPGRCTYYIDNLGFADDPRLTVRHRRQMFPGRGGPDGLNQPRRDEAGVWHVTRDIVLGARIPGYPARE